MLFLHFNSLILKVLCPLHPWFLCSTLLFLDECAYMCLGCPPVYPDGCENVKVVSCLLKRCLHWQMGGLNVCGHSWKLIVTVTASGNHNIPEPPFRTSYLHPGAYRCQVFGQQVKPADQSFELGMQSKRLAGSGQKLICVASTNYACEEAGFLDVVFVLERAAPGRCCKWRNEGSVVAGRLRMENDPKRRLVWRGFHRQQ